MTDARTLLGGTDGFRGAATNDSGPGLVNEGTIAGASYALVGHQQAAGITGPVIIAQDTRPSGERLRAAAIDGALARGAEVWDLETVPTPLAQKVAREHNAMATIVITASHNPAADNGWKGMPGSQKPSASEVQAISDLYWDNVDKGLVISPGDKASVHKRPDLISWYEDILVADIQNQFGDKPLQGSLFVVDGAYGATQQVTPKILERLGATVEPFSCDGSGIINDGCGAADLSGLKHFLSDHPDLLHRPGFVGAIANDGDGDRMMGVGALSDDTLVDIDGNHVLWALAQGQPGVVGTLYTNSGLVEKLSSQGIGFEYCPNGDVFVTEKLRELQAAGKPWTRGGEFSGHHVVMDWLASGDGIRTAAWFAAWVVAQGKTFADIYQELPLWSQQMTAVPCADATQKAMAMESKAVLEAIQQGEQTLASNGRLVVRPSGTEPVIRIWAEGKDAAQLKTIVDKISETIRSQAMQTKGKA